MCSVLCLASADRRRDYILDDPSTDDIDKETFGIDNNKEVVDPYPSSEEIENRRNFTRRLHRCHIYRHHHRFRPYEVSGENLLNKNAENQEHQTEYGVLQGRRRSHGRDRCHHFGENDRYSRRNGIWKHQHRDRPQPENNEHNHKEGNDDTFNKLHENKSSSN